LYDFGFADCLLACTDAPPTTIPSWATTTATTSGKYIQYVNLSLDKKQFVLTLPVNINAHKLFIMSARIKNSLGGMLGSYNPLLIIVIICTVNVPQIKQANKLKAQTNPLILKQTNKLKAQTNPLIPSCCLCNRLNSAV
jgi:hypothetical protein